MKGPGMLVGNFELIIYKPLKKTNLGVAQHLVLTPKSDHFKL